MKGSSISGSNAAEEAQMMLKVFPSGVPCDLPPSFDDQCCGRSVSPGACSLNTVSSSISTVPSPVVDVVSESHSGSLASSDDVASPQSSESAKNSKEFKLNPGAKIFCPSSATPLLATAAVPAAASVAYLPSNSSVVPVVAASQFEVGNAALAPLLPIPAKFAPYPCFAAVNGVDGPPFPLPIIGRMGGTSQPSRYAGQLYPTFVPPNSHAVSEGSGSSSLANFQVMVGNGRLGQFVYLQPVHHSVGPLCAPPMLTSNQVQYRKHQAGQPLPPLTVPVPANPLPPHSLSATNLQ